ncbi:hypothetical protein B5807_00044 [Epicoccum nigrum]|uniref:SAP domain-containing protein n=1 Tax=Epicoccum nigrum TaxID=105696 RepID=A0A1Y2MFT1_EPING|nr:hypothetical protein B5807_00044 [Epicoccum nigrum]
MSVVEAQDAPHKWDVMFTKLFVQNSIFAYREFRKRDKYVVELATRASDPVMQGLNVKCLNAYQEKVRKAQKDPANGELMKMLQQCKQIEEDREALVEAGAAYDPMDLVDVAGPSNKKRTSIKPKRFAQAKFVHGHPLYPGDEGCTDAEDDDDDVETGPRRSKRKIKGKKKQVGPVLEDDASDEDSDDKATVFLKKRLSTEDEKYAASEAAGQTSESDYDDSCFNEDSGEDQYLSDPGAAANSSGDDSDVGPSTAQKRKEKRLAFEAFHREEQEDEAVRQLQLLLSNDSERIYTIEDLKNESILSRGLEITYCMRAGQQPDKVPSIHINYDAIRHTLDDTIKQQMKKDDSAGLLKDILSSQIDEAPDAHLQSAKATSAAVDSNSSEDARVSNRDYSGYAAKELRSLISRRGISLQGAKKKDDYIRLLRSHDEIEDKKPDGDKGDRKDKGKRYRED